MAYQSNYTGLQLDKALSLINGMMTDPEADQSSLVGYRMSGILIPSSPAPREATEGRKLCYLVVTPGRYSNLNDALELPVGNVGLILWNGSEWSIVAIEMMKVMTEDEYAAITPEPGKFYLLTEDEEV